MAECLFCDPVEQAGAVMSTARMFVRFDKVPATPGHVEVVPRRHVVSLWHLRPWEAWSGWRLLRKAQRLLAAQYHPDGWNIGINDGRAAGRSIDHLHIHLIPRYHGDQDDPRGGIRRGLPNGDPDEWAVQLGEARRG